MNSPPHIAAGTSAMLQYKNQLQEYTQKSSIALPVYQTFIEGPPHAARFRSKVWVDGVCFTSPNAFSNKKMAEQDAARHALSGVLEKVKSEEPSNILDNITLCKSIMNEYALKMNVKPPTYTTNSTATFTPMFTSSLELNGITYVGQTAKTKKEAEHLAARSAILSILGYESSATTMSEIIKSKYKYHDTLKNAKDLPGGQAGTSNVATDAVNLSQHSAAPFSVVEKKNEGHAIDGVTVAEIPQSSPLVPHNQLPDVIQNVHSDFAREHAPDSTARSYPVYMHVFKKPRLSQPAPVVIAPLPELAIPRIEFVPPGSVQAPASKKKNRKKKKGKKTGQLHQSPFPVGIIAQSSAPAYPLLQ